ncbi:DUF3419 family protein [Thalassoroseus pseudoceratinae]|uniref:DUF3419 family protein n=1 Tax=Thalassoroseus pseudoceratinae TaxID=2713176 RepID=UPI0014208B28|nr:BtaA family protein [Thalassoroseus pseudoceratinae]
MFLESLTALQFRMVHSRNLVYNTCWEDPRLDRVALQLGENDTIAMITSAGCNALDYALDNPKRIDAIDMNPRQNALLQLKQAAIRTLDYSTFFQLFGEGRLLNWRDIYEGNLRDMLPAESQQFWDRRGHSFFTGKVRRSFYFRGSSGIFAWFVNHYMDRVLRIREALANMLSAKTVEEQCEIYQREQLRSRLFKPYVRWLVRRNSVLSMLGVPKAQRLQLERGHEGGVAEYIMDCIEAVFARLPLHDNYFWRVYMTGSYTKDCCPEYLKRKNFERLKAGLVDRIHTHTTTVTDFLNNHTEPVSRFVLLDHMDWMSVGHRQKWLAEEWQAIADRSAPDTRLIWRSAGLTADFIDSIEIERNQTRNRVGDWLEYDTDLATALHPKDRVHTYGSFYIAKTTNS